MNSTINPFMQMSWDPDHIKSLLSVKYHPLDFIPADIISEESSAPTDVISETVDSLHTEQSHNCPPADLHLKLNKLTQNLCWEPLIRGEVFWQAIVYLTWSSATAPSHFNNSNNGSIGEIFIWRRATESSVRGYLNSWKLRCTLAERRGERHE